MRHRLIAVLLSFCIGSPVPVGIDSDRDQATLRNQNTESKTVEAGLKMKLTGLEETVEEATARILQSLHTSKGQWAPLVEFLNAPERTEILIRLMDPKQAKEILAVHRLEWEEKRLLPKRGVLGRWFSTDPGDRLLGDIRVSRWQAEQEAAMQSRRKQQPAPPASRGAPALPAAAVPKPWEQWIHDDFLPALKRTVEEHSSDLSSLQQAGEQFPAGKALWDQAVAHLLSSRSAVLLDFTTLRRWLAFLNEEYFNPQGLLLIVGRPHGDMTNTVEFVNTLTVARITDHQKETIVGRTIHLYTIQPLFPTFAGTVTVQSYFDRLGSMIVVNPAAYESMGKFPWNQGALQKRLRYIPPASHDEYLGMYKAVRDRFGNPEAYQQAWVQVSVLEEKKHAQDAFHAIDDSRIAEDATDGAVYINFCHTQLRGIWQEKWRTLHGRVPPAEEMRFVMTMTELSGQTASTVLAEYPPMRIAGWLASIILSPGSQDGHHMAAIHGLWTCAYGKGIVSQSLPPVFATSRDEVVTLVPLGLELEKAIRGDIPGFRKAIDRKFPESFRHPLAEPPLPGIDASGELVPAAGLEEMAQERIGRSVRTVLEQADQGIRPTIVSHGLVSANPQLGMVLGGLEEQNIFVDRQGDLAALFTGLIADKNARSVVFVGLEEEVAAARAMAAAAGIEEFRIVTPKAWQGLLRLILEILQAATGMEEEEMRSLVGFQELMTGVEEVDQAA